jgi:2-polyprenyl-6-methoxyphenol hydroxylase-like FAD-dependent oxidoreductase
LEDSQPHFSFAGRLDAAVYEQAVDRREVGAGIVVSPNMVRPLHALGLVDELTSFAVRLDPGPAEEWDLVSRQCVA